MKTLIRGGTIVNAGRSFLADVLAEDGVIARVEPNIDERADETINAAGCYVFPGFIDTHTHFDLDLGVTVTADNFDTGSKAAILGGTTTVLDFATQDRGMTMQDALEKWHKKARGASCNYGFHMAVSEWNDARAAEMDAMIAAGVTSFKMYMVYDAMRVDDGCIYRALKLAAAKDCIIGVHCENYDVLQARIAECKAAGFVSPAAHPVSRPADVEAEAVARLMRIARLADAPVWVVHLSTEQGLAEALRARERGQEVYLETCPQYLVLTDERYLDADAEKFIMSPPLRKAADSAALLGAMGKGEIDFVGTDHCSFTMAQKALGGGDFSKVPNGGAGVRNRAQLVYTYAVRAGHITLNQMAEQLSQNAAKLFGMYPQKGEVRVGADADIAVFDPRAKSVISHRTNAHNCDNSPFEGIAVKGAVCDVLLGGHRVVANGQLKIVGAGRFVFRKPSGRPRA